MTIVDYDTYETDKLNFFRKQNYGHTRYTTPLTNGEYHTNFIFENGAVYYEHCSTVYETVSVNTIVKGVKVTLTQNVKLFRVEYWTSEDAHSKFYYSKY